MHDDGCKVICKRHGECVRKLEENVKRKKLLRNKYIDEDDYDEWCICYRSSYLEHHITLFMLPLLLLVSFTKLFV